MSSLPESGQSLCTIPDDGFEWCIGSGMRRSQVGQQFRGSGFLRQCNVVRCPGVNEQKLRVWIVPSLVPGIQLSSPFYALAI